jgi:hypothetical protein
MAQFRIFFGNPNFDCGQDGVPTADQDAGSWVPSSGSDLFAMLDETVADDADYVRSGTSTNRLVMKLSGLARPGTGSVKLEVRHRDSP